MWSWKICIWIFLTHPPVGILFSPKSRKCTALFSFNITGHGIWSHHFMENRWGNNGNSDRFYFLGIQNHCSREIKRHLLLGRKAMTNLDCIVQKKRYHFADKGSYSQSYGFSSNHVRMWELANKEAWAPKRWCFQTVGWRRLLRVSWTARRSKQSILKAISLEYSF